MLNPIWKAKASVIWEHTKWYLAAIIAVAGLILGWIYGSHGDLRALLLLKDRSKEAAQRAAMAIAAHNRLVVVMNDDDARVKKAEVKVNTAEAKVLQLSDERQIIVAKLDAMDDDHIRAREYNARHGLGATDVRAHSAGS